VVRHLQQPPIAPAVRGPAPQPIGIAAPPVQFLPLGAFLLYAFLILSRLPEFLPRVPKLILIVGFAMAALAILSSGFRLLESRTATLLALLTAWMAACGMLGEWRGGSARIIYGWLACFLIVLGGIHVMRSARAARSLFYTVGLAVGCLACLGVAFSKMIANRIAAGEGSFSDPNDFAACLLFGLPFMAWMFIELKGSPFRRILLLAVMLIAFFSIFWTGSRGALLAVIILSAVVWFRVSLGKKLLLLGVGGLTAAALFATLPDTIRARYATLYKSGAELPTEATESAAIRKELVRVGLKVILDHPLMGVGPGQFTLGANDIAIEEGRRPYWRSPHNSYLQVVTETGIPGFLLYAAVLVSVFRLTWWVSKYTRNQPHCASLANAAFCLRLALISYLVTSTFLQHAYMSFVPTLSVTAFGLRQWALEVLRPDPARPPAPAA